MKIRCKNEDGYGNVVYVEYEVAEPVEDEPTDEDYEKAGKILMGKDPAEALL